MTNNFKKYSHARKGSCVYVLVNMEGIRASRVRIPRFQEHYPKYRSFCGLLSPSLGGVLICVSELIVLTVLTIFYAGIKTEFSDWVGKVVGIIPQMRNMRKLLVQTGGKLRYTMFCWQRIFCKLSDLISISGSGGRKSCFL